MISFLYHEWPEFQILKILFKTWIEAKSDPLIHLLLYLNKSDSLFGGSVKATDPGMYLRMYLQFAFTRISRHITLSSARYMLASNGV